MLGTILALLNALVIRDLKKRQTRCFFSRASEDSNLNTNDLALPHLRAPNGMNAMQFGSPQNPIFNDLSKTQVIESKRRTNGNGKGRVTTQQLSQLTAIPALRIRKLFRIGRGRKKSVVGLLFAALQLQFGRSLQRRFLGRDLRCKSQERQRWDR